MTSLRKIQRYSYLFSRTVGDVDAAGRHRLPQRLVRRVVHRKVIGLLRRGRLW